VYGACHVARGHVIPWAAATVVLIQHGRAAARHWNVDGRSTASTWLDNTEPGQLLVTLSNDVCISHAERR